MGARLTTQVSGVVDCSAQSRGAYRALSRLLGMFSRIELEQACRTVR